MLDAKIFSGNDFKNRLIFEMDGTAYSLNYAEIDTLINPKIHKGRIAGCADISSFYSADYVIGCWENPTTHFVSLLLDMRLLLGLEKREYSPSTVICTLYEEDLRKYAFVLDGLSERFADEEKTSSRIVVEIALREILSGADSGSGR